MQTFRTPGNPSDDITDEISSREQLIKIEDNFMRGWSGLKILQTEDKQDERYLDRRQSRGNLICCYVLYNLIR